ncbi:MAG: trehalase-like domain-containing protein, partial [Solirubrobacteraceae bacterium]
MPSSQEPYPPIADYGLIGDCRTAALISRQGSIDWCCLPRFDSGAAFARLLDHERGGHCTVAPRGRRWTSSRRYVEDTLVLETTFEARGGNATLYDFFVAADEPGPRLVRLVEATRGSVDMEVRVAPRFDYGEVRPWIRRHGHRLFSAIGGNDGLIVWCDEELEEDPAHELVVRFTLAAGDRRHLSLSYCAPELIDAHGGPDEPDVADLDRTLDETVSYWRKWSETLALRSDDEPGARRSGLTLKALT